MMQRRNRVQICSLFFVLLLTTGPHMCFSLTQGHRSVDLGNRKLLQSLIDNSADGGSADGGNRNGNDGVSNSGSSSDWGPGGSSSNSGANGNNGNGGAGGDGGNGGGNINANPTIDAEPVGVNPDIKAPGADLSSSSGSIKTTPTEVGI